MRVYKFLDAHFGLKSLYEKRLKISRIHDLNDPFELLPFKLSVREHRLATVQEKRRLATNRGVLCFSAGWDDPVVWAHYSDKHRGICLGFEVPDAYCDRVKYVSKRLPFPKTATDEVADAWLFTKYRNWQYEQEIRIMAPLGLAEGGLYFRDFDAALRLVKIIAGAQCTIPQTALRRALGNLANQTQVVKARAAFNSFKIVKNQRGFETGTSR